MISAKNDKCEVSGKDIAAVEIKIEGSHTEVMVEFRGIIIALIVLVLPSGARRKWRRGTERRE